MLVGRKAEIAEIERAFADLGRTDAPPTAMHFVGQPGVGKTTVLRVAMRRAVAHGFATMVTTATPHDGTIPYSALGDLLRSGGDHSFLPGPQRAALEAAALGTDGGADGIAPNLVASALTTLMARRAEGSGLVILVDDTQWLDPSSRAALARALGAQTARVLLLSAARPGATDEALSVGGLLGTVREIRLDGLARDELAHVVRDQLEVTLALPTAARLADVSGGNPLLALEIVRAMKRGAVGALSGDSAMPVPERVAEAIRQRLAALDETAAEVVAVAAAMARPTESVIRQVLPSADAGLAAALRAGVLENVANVRLRLYHPMARDVAIGLLPATRRRDIHRRLAAAIPDQVERAGHLAEATEEPDAHVAETLSAAAVEAQRRGAPAIAARLAERAARLTPAGDHAGTERWSFAIRGYYEAGDTDQARAVAVQALHGSPDAAVRHAIGRLQSEADSIPAAIESYRAALAAEPDEALRAAVLRDLAGAHRLMYGDADSLDLSRAAVAAAEKVGDPGLLTGCLCVLSVVEFALGLPDAPAHLARAEELERAGRVDVAIEWSPAFVRVLHLTGSGAARAGRAAAEQALADCPPDQVSVRGRAMYFLTWAELRCGNLRRAAELAAEGVRHAEHGGSIYVHAMRWLQALTAAHLGDLDDAEALAHQVVQGAAATGMRFWEQRAKEVLGFVALCRGEPGPAMHWFGQARPSAHPPADFEPGVRQHLCDIVEALVMLGRADAAEQVLAPFAAAVDRRDRPQLAGVVARCRALISSARGELDAAVQVLLPYTSPRWDGEDAFQLARNDLVLGTVYRRQRRRGEARAQLQAAHDRFDAIGANGWAGRAFAELPRAAADGDALTPTERAVAAQVAAGRSNREIAEALFVTVKTVEWNLTRVYRKLGVRGRAELAAKYPELGR